MLCILFWNEFICCLTGSMKEVLYVICKQWLYNSRHSVSSREYTTNRGCLFPKTCVPKVNICKCKFGKLTRNKHTTLSCTLRPWWDSNVFKSSIFTPLLICISAGYPSTGGWDYFLIKSSETLPHLSVCSALGMSDPCVYQHRTTVMFLSHLRWIILILHMQFGNRTELCSVCQ